MKIAIVGGSNSVIKESYVNLLTSVAGTSVACSGTSVADCTYIIDNKAIGATSSIYGLLQIQKYDLIKENDLLIFEYFVNDNNHYFQGINSVERVRKTLISIINQCIKENKKMLIIMIYNKADQSVNMIKSTNANSNHCNSVLFSRYSASPMFNLYTDIIKTYEIPFIDMYHVFYRKVLGRWTYYYQDDTHLNLAGMTILKEEIMKKIPTLQCITYKPNLDYNAYDNLSLIQVAATIADNKDQRTFSNALVNIQYLIINDSLTLNFDAPTELLAIEYICDQQAGYIEVSTDKTVIQKNTLKEEDFVLKRNKTMVALITFNKRIFEPATSYSIRVIKPKELNKDLYDREKVTSENFLVRNTNFKIASLLVTNQAHLLMH